jgi:hypothetical protein
MRGAVSLAIWIGLAAAPAGAGSECSEWVRLDNDGKVARIGAMIEGHLNSNVGKRYTSENRVAMRMCLERFAPEIRAQFDGACASDNRAPDALDEIFDRYFLSCVQ